MKEMVRQLGRMGIKDGRVLAAIAAVDRKDFVPDKYSHLAYKDTPIPIGYEQTISQPYTVARMIELLIEDSNIPLPRQSGGVSPLNLRGDNFKVLEIGTGSGWQTAILYQLFGQVYSMEIIPELLKRAKNVIRNSVKPHPQPLSLNQTCQFALREQERGAVKMSQNIHFKVRDGKAGWQKHAPYDAIICGANATIIPEAWKEQLKTGGRIVCPVKGEMTRITKITRYQDIRYQEEKFGRYVFVPLV